MLNGKIDLRSDTVTVPCPAMRQAMYDAEVGDDVIDIDPTTQRLQNRIAELLGKEAAIFMPSGTMTNQVAIRVHCQPGDELLCDSGCHIYNYEQAAFAQFSGVVARTVEGSHGVMRLTQLEPLIRPVNEHMARTRLVCLENTHNRGGGRVYDFNELQAICQWARKQGLKSHLDGARLFNAVIASGISAARWCEHFDTVSVCFSKGLGAPVGSALAGAASEIASARRQRKVFGGGMRQSGFIAAAALYALDHNIDRLAEDHAAARLIADAIRGMPGLTLEPEEVETNIVIFRVDPQLASAEEFAQRLKTHNVSLLAFSKEHLRAVTHLHVTEDDAIQAGQAIQQVAHSFKAK
jgi:threonine aldolase